MIGQGKSVKEALTEIGQTAEGIQTIKVVWKEAQNQGVEMPIVNSLYKIIFEGVPLGKSMKKVLGINEVKDVEFLR